MLSPKRFGLSPPQMDMAFPCHFVLDATMHIGQCGSTLCKLIPDAGQNPRFEDIFSVKTPAIPVSFRTIADQAFTVFFLCCKKREFTLRGQFLEDKEANTLTFVGSPVIRDIETISGLDLSLNDFAVHDTQIDLLLVLQAKNNTIDDSKRMADQLRKEVNERRAAQDALQKANTELEFRVEQRTADLSLALDAAQVAEKTKDAFLANVSHEMRTPLTTIIGVAELALRKDMPAEQREDFERIGNAGRNLSGLINDLLDLAKIAAGRIELETSPFNTRKMIEHIRSMMEPRAEAKELPLDIQIDSNVDETIVGDSLRIEQILLNLLSNAIKFTEQGSVTLRVTQSPSDANHIRLDFEVTDTGIGITPSGMKSLFCPFSQADTSITRRFGGTGLGLALCKRLVELMNGEITVISEPGVGSRFSFFLVLDKHCSGSQTKEETAIPFAQTPLPSGKRALVVDDDVFIRKIACALLKAMNIETIEADNGADAVEILIQHEPTYFDIALMDVQMPIMDGLTATRCIRELDGFDRLPIVAITGHAMEHEKQNILSVGVNDLIGKPFDPTTFEAKVNRNLKK